MGVASIFLALAWLGLIGFVSLQPKPPGVDTLQHIADWFPFPQMAMRVLQAIITRGAVWHMGGAVRVRYRGDLPLCVGAKDCWYFSGRGTCGGRGNRDHSDLDSQPGS